MSRPEVDSTRLQDRGGQGSDRRALLGWIALAGVWKLCLAAFVTHWTLVDDAYITLRYARNAAQGTGLVYNAGEDVFGVTAPAWGFVTWALHAVFGSATPVAVTVLGVLLGGWMAWLVAQDLPRTGRWLGVALCLAAPAIVDNQLLGMETPLFVALALAAGHYALRGRALAAAVCAGWVVVTRPEGILLAPFLVWAFARARGVAGLRELLRPRVLLALLGPGLAWIAFATAHYGSILPQSMLAKSGWNSTHYDGLFSARSALWTFPRLTFLPFVDRLPTWLAWPSAVAVLAGVVAVGAWNLRRGTSASRLWMGFYTAYTGFYLVGKGATEASWYAVPSTVAIVLAAGPLLPELRPRAVRFAACAALVAASTAASVLRAPLLQSYVDGYGTCAARLNELPGEHRVVIGEIGVFGYESRHAVTDVGALVSPEVLPWKNAGHSFVRIVQESGADLFVICRVALERNHYPSVGSVWSGAEEERWLTERCELVCEAHGRLAYRVTQEHPEAR